MVEVGEDQREEGQTLIYVILPSPRLTDQLLLDIFLMSRGEFQMRVFLFHIQSTHYFSFLSLDWMLGRCGKIIITSWHLR